MVSKVAYVGLVILVIGLIVGIYGAYAPISSAKQGSSQLLSTSLKIDPNDYESQNVPLTKGETVNIQTVSIQNQTIFYFYIMNQSEYYNFYGCAPWCRGAPNGSAAFVNGAGLSSVPLSTFVNISGITPSNPYTNHNFTAPTNGTYYFVFDNTMGPSYTTYDNQSAAGNTLGQFTLLSYGTVNTKAVNSTILYVGVAILIIGGAIATATWDSGRTRPKSPPKVTTTSTPPSPPPSPATTT